MDAFGERSRADNCCWRTWQRESFSLNKSRCGSAFHCLSHLSRKMRSTGSTTMSSRQFVFGITFICIIRWLSEDTPSISLGIATGLSMALTYLTKLSNLPLILVAIGTLAWWSIAQARSRNLRETIPALGALTLCAATPIVAWLVWMKRHFGDF